MLKHMFEYDTMTKENRKIYDWILILGIFLAALILWGILRFTGQPGDKLSVSYEGEVLEQISLNGSEDRYYLIRCENTEIIELSASQAEENMQGQYNLFVCKEDGTVYMLSASCPDQICVNHRPIGRSHDNIICLPHRLVLEIISDRDDEAERLDGVAY